MPTYDLVDRLPLIFDRVSEIEAFPTPAKRKLQPVGCRLIVVHWAAGDIAEHAYVLNADRFIQSVLFLDVLFDRRRQLLFARVKIARRHADKDPRKRYYEQRHRDDNQ